MTIKPFEIQGAQLKLGGVQLEAGTTSVVIPGVTRATSYRVEEVEDTVDQTQTFSPSHITVIDYVTFQELLNETGDGSTRADYVTELDGDGYIDDLEVGGHGSYTQQEAADNANNDMYGYIGSGLGSDRPIVPEDWVQIPFRPKMRAGEVEREAGGSGASALSDLEDTDIGDLSTGEALVWNGEVWTNQTINGGSGDIGNLRIDTWGYPGDSPVRLTPQTYGESILIQTTDNPEGNQGRSSLRWHVRPEPDGEGSQYSQVDVQNDGVWIKNADWTGSGGQWYWHFGNDGVLTFPDGSTQVTAYTGGFNGTPTVYSGTTPPESPTAGTLWYDSESGRMFIYYGDTWVDSSIGGDSSSSGGSSGATTLSGLTDIQLNTPTNNQVLTYSDASGTWINQSVPLPTTLTDLGITDGTSGQVLTTDGSGGFTFTTVSSGSGTSLPADSTGYLRNDGSGTLSWSTNTVTAGSPAYSDVWVISSKADNFWSTYSLTGNVAVMYSMGSDTDLTLSNQTVYGKQISSGDKILTINDGPIHTNDTYGMVVEFPADPSVGDTFATPVSSVTTTVNAGSFVVGQTYTILSAGTTNWSLIGAMGGYPGQSFVATGPGSGSGTATTTAGFGKLIFKPASGQRAILTQQGNSGVTQITIGQGSQYIATYINLGGQFGVQPITWVYAGVIGSVPTWYQMYF